MDVITKLFSWEIEQDNHRRLYPLFLFIGAKKTGTKTLNCDSVTATEDESYMESM